ncbi:GMC family oxidoreductase [Microbacterium sp. X-17]|uniref:GMC family oxidoreductase n=1 Tax=Microbacterium sp. X-17 TaxID=3144404 RepID=UPI0031F4C991
MTTRTADYVIAGGGTAGAVVARRLADQGHEVILIEAGPTGVGDPRVEILTRWEEMIETDLDWDLPIEPATAGNPAVRYAQGRILGGSSAHNNAIAFRAASWDLDRWAELGATGWAANDCEPYWERVFGRVTLEDARHDHPWAQAFLAAGQQAGLPLVDMGAPDIAEGIGWFRQNKHGERRTSSAVAYLFPLDALPPSLTVLTGVTVLRVLLDEAGDAIGVATSDGDVLARKEVVVSGGTFGSPKILMLSGIGPADALRAAGIEPRVDLPGVGGHLVDHVETTVLWEAYGPPDFTNDTHWTVGFFATIDRGDADGGARHPEIQANLSTTRSDEITVAAGYPSAEHVFSLHPNVANPRGEGRVSLRSADPADPVRIVSGHFADGDGYEAAVLAEGIRWVRRLAAQPAFAGIIKRELAPGPELTGDEELAEYARRTSYTGFHPVGTCRMGAADDPDAVVDAELRVRGVGRLRVADASVFPTITSANPCMTVMMVAERCAAFLAGER